MTKFAAVYCKKTFIMQHCYNFSKSCGTGSRKNNFTFLVPIADASRLTALRKLGICQIFLHFRALPAGRLNA